MRSEIETCICVRMCEWRHQRVPPWMNERREGCNSSPPLLCSTAVRELKVNIWDRTIRSDVSVFLSSCNALFYSWINVLRVPGHLIAILQNPSNCYSAFTTDAARASKWPEVIHFQWEPAASSGESRTALFGQWERWGELKSPQLYGNVLWRGWFPLS